MNWLERNVIWIILVVVLLDCAVICFACVPMAPTPTATPDAECQALRTRLPILETRLAESDDTARYLMQTAVALETQCAATPTIAVTPTTWPTPTPWALPTASSTPAAGMCADCTGNARLCPTGMTCWYCPSLGYRCVDPQSVNGSCNICKQQIAVIDELDWHATGLCVHYVDGMTASGEEFNTNALTCAVDKSLWPLLRGRTLRLTRLDTSASIDVVVNDWGLLQNSGWWAWGVRAVGCLEVARYWPSTEGIGHQVLIDLPAGTAERFAPDTILIEARALNMVAEE